MLDASSVSGGVLQLSGVDVGVDVSGAEVLVSVVVVVVVVVGSDVVVTDDGADVELLGVQLSVLLVGWSSAPAAPV